MSKLEDNLNDILGIETESISTEEFKEPTVSYSVSLPNADYIDLGHLLEIDVPTLTKSAVLPVVGYDISIDDKVSTTFQVGQSKVTVKEYIDLLSKPSDR